MGRERGSHEGDTDTDATDSYTDRYFLGLGCMYVQAGTEWYICQRIIDSRVPTHHYITECAIQLDTFETSGA